MNEHDREAAELRRLADEQATLGRVANLVAGDAEPERIFQTVTEEVCRLLGLRSALMQRFEDAETARIVGLYSEEAFDGLEVGTVQRLDEGLSALQVLRTGAPAHVDNYDELEGETASLVRSLGFRATVAVPIAVAGATWGALIVGLREGESLPPETERRLTAFAGPVALALASADAREKLAASRARIVEAGYVARRRLERNLHDGAQQRLVSLALTLGLARGRLEDDHPAASLLLEADEQLKAALEELRELAQGLHPALLVERGLGPALAALATRAPFPVGLTQVPTERLPEPVEATAYYVVSEALANAAKHADASSATVRVERAGELAVVEIADDGRGGATTDRGSGLLGLMDRVEALGGRLEIDSPPSRGTVVRAQLPLAAGAALTEERSPGDGRASTAGFS